MATFADQMASFTEHLRSSIRERGEALTQVREATDHLLQESRTFLNDVSREHHARSRDLSESLGAIRARRAESMSAMREAHQESFRQMKRNLKAMLKDSREARMQAVGRLREEAGQARMALSEDLHEASRAWHTFAAHGRTAAMTPPKPKHFETKAPTKATPKPSYAHATASAKPSPAAKTKPKAEPARASRKPSRKKMA